MHVARSRAMIFGFGFLLSGFIAFLGIAQWFSVDLWRHHNVRTVQYDGFPRMFLRVLWRCVFLTVRRCHYRFWFRLMAPFSVNVYEFCEDVFLTARQSAQQVKVEDAVRTLFDPNDSKRSQQNNWTAARYPVDTRVMFVRLGYQLRSHCRECKSSL